MARVTFTLLTLLMMILSQLALSHEVSPQDIIALKRQSDTSTFVMMGYLGGKHMVTGLDHLLFLFGVMFLITHWRDIGWFATLFAVGHTITLVSGSVLQFGINPYLTDLIIGFSVVFKGFENLLAMQNQSLGIPPRAAVFGFGLIHGLGLAARVEDLGLPAEGLITRILAFNIGVEIGQLIALSIILIVLGCWRKLSGFKTHAYWANLTLITAGACLMLYQATAFMVS